MLISKKENRGFSLVEVIVSMLVLSIVIASVLTAFSLSAKVNAKTRKLQSAESLMEDLVELAGAVKDSSKYVDTLHGLYGGSVEEKQHLSETQKVEIKTITGVDKGAYTFEIEVTRDTEPTKYTNMNDQKVLSFGATGKKTALIDASKNGNLNLGSSVHRYDKWALDYFVTQHNAKIDEMEADEDIEVEESDKKTKSQIQDMMDRDVILEAVNLGGNKMQLKAHFVYKVPDSNSMLLLPADASRELKDTFYTSAVYDSAAATGPSVEKIDRVYLLYSPCEGEVTSSYGNCDVRIIDPGQVLGAEVYLLYQEDSKKAITSDLISQELSTRFDSKEIEVTFGYKGAMESAPGKVDLYSPAEIICNSGFENVSVYSNTLVSMQPSIRVQELTIKVTDSLGNEMATATVACLQ